ncbi:hypothetical protein JG688_00006120 [Phytophthora aleatoria]|uniref:Uncharacterized protein n=1 Tax=Phytophthora aleatoria TaxID=2496075 RepID=A0A8J5IR31_9STRA|nr:hypothetical protein JG688_00006120 [Phytophthora aleatoria]
MQQPPELLAYKALQAVQRGNAEELAKLIQAGANAHVINAVVKTGTSPNGHPDRVFELALTPENTRTCTLVFVLKHSGMVASLNERIASGMMPFPYIPVGHSLTHKLLLMNSDQVAGRLEIYLEAY